MSKSDLQENPHLTLMLLALFILVSWALRLYQLEAKSIWSDEGLSIYRARKSIAFNLTNKIIVQDVVTKDTQPPLYFILLRAFRAVGGESEFTLRFPSVIFATLIIPGLYALGKRLISAQAGIFAALLAAASPTYLWYAQEIRMYTMLVFLSLLSLYTLLRLLSEKIGWRQSKVLWLLAYLFTTGAMVYTHYSGLFLLVFEGVLVAAFTLHSRRWRMIGLMALALLAISPLLPFVLRRLGTGVERDFTFVPLDIILLDLLNGFSVGISVNLANTVWLDALGVGVFLFGLWTLRGNGIWGERGKSLFLFGHLLLPVLTLYAASYIKPMYMGVRHLIIASPAYYLGAGAALDYLSQKRLWIAGAVIGIGLLMGNAYATENYFKDPAYVKDDLRGLSHYIRKRYRPGDILVLNDAVIGKTVDYYAPDVTWTAQPKFGHMTNQATFQALQALAEQYARIWFVYGPPSTFYDPAHQVRAWLDDHLFRLDFRRFVGYGNEVGVLCYATESPILGDVLQPAGQALASKSAQDGPPLKLVTYTLPPPTPSGEPLPVDLYWRLTEDTDANYKTSIRLLDAQGTLWAQSDQPPFYFFPTSEWPVAKTIEQVHDLLLPPGTPPGQYRLSLRVYRADTGEVLSLVNPETGSLVSDLALGSVQIEEAVQPVRPTALPTERPRISFGEDLQLVAHTDPGKVYAPDAIVHLDLYWKATQKLNKAYQTRIQIVNDRGDVAYEEIAVPGLASVPTSQWPSGHILRDQHNMLLPSGLSKGSYKLQLQVLTQNKHILGVRKGFIPLLRNHWILANIQIQP